MFQETKSNHISSKQLLFNFDIQNTSSLLLRWSSIALVSTAWLSAALFGLYILAFYATTYFEDNLQMWNNIVIGLYAENKPTATAGLVLHFIMGGIILVLGYIQLIKKVRARYPSVHRWLGRIYVTASFFAAIGGLIYIAFQGTVGGTVMNIGFSLYGVLMLVASVQTFRYAKAREISLHRQWAMRLFSLTIASWLYRMYYGFWLLLIGFGHTPYFDGPFDMVMSFFFYLPNLLIVEILIRSEKKESKPLVKFVGAGVFLTATFFLAVGSFYFTMFYWGPAILSWFS